MIGNAELEVLGAVDPGQSVTELAAALGNDASHVSRTVASLAERGLVHTDPDGRRKRIRPARLRAVELYRECVERHPSIPLADLLTTAAIAVCYHFDRPSTVAELADRCGTYRNTVNRVCNRLARHAIVSNSDGVYSFNGGFDRLHAFARELVRHLHRERLASVAADGAVLWETHDAFLARIETAVRSPAFVETGPARLADFEVAYPVAGPRHYVHDRSTDGLAPGDLVAHTLLLDDGGRYRSHCLLVLAAVEWTAADLLSRAARYGVADEVETLLQYLETGGDARDRRLPPWGAFQQMLEACVVSA